jgi:oxazoline/thiazoline synthase
MWVLDITSDLKIPVFVALSRNQDQLLEEITYGFGAHFDPRLAIQRAITELNQSLAIFSTKTINLIPQRISTQYLQDQNGRASTFREQNHVIPKNLLSPKSYSDYCFYETGDLLDDVFACLDVAKKHGFEMLILDQTRPDIDVKVVKVIVPGLRHFWKRTGTGRLYEVPVNLGYLSKPTSEHDLNKVPLG